LIARRDRDMCAGWKRTLRTKTGRPHHGAVSSVVTEFEGEQSCAAVPSHSATSQCPQKKPRQRLRDGEETMRRIWTPNTTAHAEHKKAAYIEVNESFPALRRDSPANRLGRQNFRDLGLWPERKDRQLQFSDELGERAVSSTGAVFVLKGRAGSSLLSRARHRAAGKTLLPLYVRDITLLKKAELKLKQERGVTSAPTRFVVRRDSWLDQTGAIFSFSAARGRLELATRKAR